MRTAAATLIVFALAAGSLDAQGRGRNRANSQGIPPGQMPAAGQCRVWYDGVPPGRQPRATNCREAERVAARDRNARVIYGDDRYNDQYGTGRVYEDGRYEDRSRGSNGVTDAVRDRIRNRFPTSGVPSAGLAQRLQQRALRQRLPGWPREGPRRRARQRLLRSGSPQPVSLGGSRLRQPVRDEGAIQARVS